LRMYFGLVENKRNIFRDLDFAYDFYVWNFIKLSLFKFAGIRNQKGKIDGRKIFTPDEANNYLYNRLNRLDGNNSPFMAARYGASEHGQMIVTLMMKYGLRDKFPEYSLISGKVSSGIFHPTQEIVLRFGELMLELSNEVDLLGYWGSLLMEEYIIKHYAKNAGLMPLRSLEPFQFNHPWTFALKGKKILVIHPFEATILSQYKKRKKLFNNPDILPDFELLTVKAEITNGDNKSNFGNWFEAFDSMYNKAMNLDFDIAILGCGAYGFPLAAKIKKAGKKAVHLGGMTQLLFGIKGSRWEASRPDIVAMYNESWVRPLEIERPKGAEKIDNAAYW
jgi:hypothetical protein